MDGRGRALDNIFVERLWRSVKYEEVYLHDYANPREARQGLTRYLEFYDHERLHQAFDCQNTSGHLFQQELKITSMERLAVDAVDNRRALAHRTHRPLLLLRQPCR